MKFTQQQQTFWPLEDAPLLTRWLRLRGSLSMKGTSFSWMFFLEIWFCNIQTQKSSMLMYLPYLLATMRSSAFLPRVGESLAARGAVRLTMMVVGMPLRLLLIENLQPGPRFWRQGRVCNDRWRWSLFLHKSWLIHIGESIDSLETGSICSDLVSSIWCL